MKHIVTTLGHIFLLTTIAGCSDVDLFQLKADPIPTVAAPSHVATLMGTYCASTPISMIFPVKILVILDDSGSMRTSDQNFRRLEATQELIDALIDKPEIYFGIEHFQNSMPMLLTQNPTFTRDKSILQSALDQSRHQPNGNTPYVSALSTAVTAISKDIEDDPQLATRTRYIVLYLSDGAPTDDREPPFEEIKKTCSTLKNLEGGEPHAGQVTLHTAYLRGGNPSQQDEEKAIQLLMEMAGIGKGEFRNFENGEALDFTDFDVTSLSRDFSTYAPILVTNINTRLTAQGLMTDSDADGLPDELELELETDPTQKDTDQDGCGDMMESVYAKWDPLTPGWETSPKHCDCDKSERQTDTDGDFLLDCEERLLALDPQRPDSDIAIDGNPSPDNMLDYLEVNWNLGRKIWDGNRDYDADGLSNLEELTLHTNPNWNEGELRESWAYRYEYVDQQIDKPICYDFLVSNVALTDTRPTQEHQAGENQILLYFVEGPQDNPLEESTIMAAMVTLKFKSKKTENMVIKIEPSQFHSLGVASKNKKTDPKPVEN